MTPASISVPIPIKPAAPQVHLLLVLNHPQNHHASMSVYWMPTDMSMDSCVNAVELTCVDVGFSWGFGWLM
jgi:hypothetical protein